MAEISQEQVRQALSDPDVLAALRSLYPEFFDAEGNLNRDVSIVYDEGNHRADGV